MRENHHHLGLCLLRGHHAKLVRRGRGIVDAHLGDGILLCGGHANAGAVIGQRVVVVEQIGVCAHALKYRSRSIECFDGGGFRCHIPTDVESLRAAWQLERERFIRVKRDAGVIKIVCEARLKRNGSLRQCKGAFACQIARLCVSFRAGGSHRWEKHCAQ